MNLYFDNIIFSLQNHGGVSVVWHELYKRFMNDQDFDIHFLKFSNYNSLGKILESSKEEFIVNGLTTLPIKVQRYLNPTVKTNNDGIFHSSYYRTTPTQNLRNITTIHDFTYEYFIKGFAKKAHNIQKLNAARNSKKIICVSTNTKQDLLKFCPDIREENVKVIFNGVSDVYKPIKNSSVEIASLVPFSHKEFVLYVGDRRSNYKNFEMAVKACSLANVPLVIVGGGKLTKGEVLLLDLFIGKTNYSPLTGLSNNELNVLYNSASFLLYPTMYEGFGIPILEAQRTGCPVISSNCSSIPEVAGDGAYLLSDISAEKISDIIVETKSRDSFCKQIIENGFTNSLYFSWDKCYEETKKVYMELEI